MEAPASIHIDETRQTLIDLSADLAAFDRMAILGEGNVSARLGGGRFLVKASGTSLATLAPEHLVEVEALPLVTAVHSGNDAGDNEMEALLLEARADPRALKPSVESLFHASLLALEDVLFVGHTHPVAVNAILCSPHAAAFARERLIPDHVVYCGAESVLVPYVDPGLILARTIAERVEAFRERTGWIPNTILLENHGLVAMGKTAGEVRAALMMAEKAARIFIDAAGLGGPIFLARDQVERIDGRGDEHYRQRMLGT